MGVIDAHRSPGRAVRAGQDAREGVNELCAYPPLHPRGLLGRIVQANGGDPVDAPSAQQEHVVLRCVIGVEPGQVVRARRPGRRLLSPVAVAIAARDLLEEGECPMRCAEHEDVGDEVVVPRPPAHLIPRRPPPIRQARSTRPQRRVVRPHVFGGDHAPAVPAATGDREHPQQTVTQLEQIATVGAGEWGQSSRRTPRRGSPGTSAPADPSGVQQACPRAQQGDDRGDQAHQQTGQAYPPMCPPRRRRPLSIGLHTSTSSNRLPPLRPWAWVRGPSCGQPDGSVDATASEEWRAIASKSLSW